MRHLTNHKATVEVQGKNVGECIEDLIEQFPGIEPKLFEKRGELHNYVEIYVNTESSYPEELAKPVNDGDILSITLMIAGG